MMRSQPTAGSWCACPWSSTVAAGARSARSTPSGSVKAIVACARLRPPSVAGVPVATMTPSRMTAIRSASRSASSM